MVNASGQGFLQFKAGGWGAKGRVGHAAPLRIPRLVGKKASHIAGVISTCRTLHPRIAPWVKPLGASLHAPGGLQERTLKIPEIRFPPNLDTSRIRQTHQIRDPKPAKNRGARKRTPGRTPRHPQLREFRGLKEAPDAGTPSSWSHLAPGGPWVLGSEAADLLPQRTQGVRKGEDAVPCSCPGPRRPCAPRPRRSCRGPETHKHQVAPKPTHPAAEKKKVQAVTRADAGRLGGFQNSGGILLFILGNPSCLKRGVDVKGPLLSRTPTMRSAPSASVGAPRCSASRRQWHRRPGRPGANPKRFSRFRGCLGMFGKDVWVSGFADVEGCGGG